ncbi:hypothetical protein [Nitrosospira multiformis]|uniref:hypothetical protein n=1 Tax=Nitrosospira multiformis TaxID=1231 RepID=UPI000894AAAE|nr:hypothetical protein [Nitrosospira multiformis]SEA74236.1 hypothetical protein SAMN05216411_12523 [Nitrosospira multiformis]
MRASEIVAQAASNDKPLQEETKLPDLELDLSEHKLQYDVDVLRQQLQENVDTHKLRKDYSHKIFILVCIWLGCVILGVLLSGFCLWGFYLSDKVLITFIASTTFNVVGLFAIVAKWMFNQNNKK